MPGLRADSRSALCARARTPLLGPREAERRTPLQRVERHDTTRALHELLHEREAHPAPLHRVTRRERLEHLKDPLVELRRNAGAVVRDRELPLVAGVAPLHPDATGLAVVVLDRISHE